LFIAVEDDRQAATDGRVPQLAVLVHGSEGDTLSNTGPQLKEPSPMLATTMPGGD